MTDQNSSETASFAKYMAHTRNLSLLGWDRQKVNTCKTIN